MNTKITGNVPAGLKRTVQKYGVESAKKIEQMMRKETAHFTSGQWLGTGTSGMEAVSGQTEFPYGWGSLATFANSHGLSSGDFFLKQYTDNHDGRKPNFIGFKDTGVFVDYVSWLLLEVRHGDILSWYRSNTASNAAARSKYATEMAKIEPKFVKQIT